MTKKTAVVTGASSGIGAATARRLAAEGYQVVAGARRRDRLEKLAAEVDGIIPVTLDVTSQESVDALAASLDRCDVLVNNAGGAIGLEPVAEGSVEDWQRMYDVNVLGTFRMTRALLPKLIESGDGVLVLVTSVAGHVSYEGGGGYCAAKHAQASMAATLRLELCGRPVRVIEVAPGMVKTEEFSLTRFRGDAERAAKVYEGVPDPLTADDIADVIAFAVTRPPHVNIDQIVVRPRAQAAQHKVHRVTQDA
ncbi:SDR family NAD(P)-dependent oxidoreductase [Thermobispora bispora]|uniref:Short-chain dehydrogenase/reductase SDR n=1 Tax=Thermobispora bispora (strain ATCC 19993 / DSM 43833 / CBS 139.67 / JCM 10125 / KCTC 9307 / NBRC 14880 / R51) TaxID=469371 RepID=D6Y4U6_THEBD|nr:SDR family NAD(P)-dependent oxidoreductase [Thermobispora bispora]ADG87221.1 short-chain dehydrogenase/reductase SDR [Thermobispora bispora DSM 43833]MBO2475206.1 KR domain-containing protein [Actinomycetales bacterium]MDI9580088.1 SDR family NAD(P)-dependent oxidoreductase [Thermobispora sp.]QSI47176.1 SDR family NAD(P)-dependent oxidoreductase [Thermobispora bispora]